MFPDADSSQHTHEQDPFAALPTETEIYVLPGGEIVIADLPHELAQRLLPGAEPGQSSDNESTPPPGKPV